MRDTVLALLVSGCVAASLAGCGDTATLPLKSGMGPRPILPPPRHTLAPTVHIAPAKGWPENTKPTPAAGLAVNAYANGLDHPRWLYVLPNGDVLVAETNAPPTINLSIASPVFTRSQISLQTGIMLINSPAETASIASVATHPSNH